MHNIAFDATQNALWPQFLGDRAPTPTAGTLPPAHPLGAQPPDLRYAPPPSTDVWVRHWLVENYSRVAGRLDAGALDAGPAGRAGGSSKRPTLQRGGGGAVGGDGHSSELRATVAASMHTAFPVLEGRRLGYRAGGAAPRRDGISITTLHHRRRRRRQNNTASTVWPCGGQHRSVEVWRNGSRVAWTVTIVHGVYKYCPSKCCETLQKSPPVTVLCERR